MGANKESKSGFEGVFLPVFRMMDKFSSSNERKIIAIDGRAASGKSTLAELLQKTYGCNVFHTDDFFLPFSLRKKERLDQPGGNIHYERMKEEIIQPLLNNETVIHRPFRCANGTFGDSVLTPPNKITVIEGVYSLHPFFGDIYDCKIFLTVDPKEQKKRLLKREGREKYHQFVTRWIPMEERYFSNFHIQESCNIVVDTTR